MRNHTWMRLLALLLAFGLIAAACGDDDSGDTAVDEPAEPADEPAEPADEPAGADLSAVCPSPLVVQTDWFPESEHGAMYQLMGDDYEINADQKSLRGSMVVGGESLGIEIEIRAGGPAIGSQAVAVIMATDDDITVGYSSLDAAILRNDVAPLLSVVAPLEKNPQIVMWDPLGLPGVETIADLGELGTTIQVFAAGTWSDVLGGLGVISTDQIDPSYDGSPARFIAEGDIAQQGFASAEPYEYENNIEEYMRPVGFQLLSDAGFEVYSQTLGIRPDRKDELDACMKQFVPIVQQATVDFYAGPDRANAIIIDAVEQYDTFWSYEPGLAAFSVQAQLDLGLAGNGPDDTVGNIDLDRVQRLLDSMRLANLDFSDDMVPEDIVTNEYIDMSIGFGAGIGGGGGAADVAVSLAGVCPDPFVIQSDWFPESEHGASYNLIGANYEVDADQKSVRGPMVLGGANLGIDVEVRAGGPAIGGGSVQSVMALDDDIHLGFSATDSIILNYAEAPVQAVVSPLEVSPGAVGWDPDTYPDVETIADLGEQGIEIQAFGGGRWHLVLAGLGVISLDQVDTSWNGSPARFIADGDIASQMFASDEPYAWNEIPEYGKFVNFQLMAEAGYDVYPSSLAVRPDKKAELDECLKLLVPIIQQSAVDFLASPLRADAIIIDAVEQYDTFWSYDDGLAAYSVQTQLDLGLASNGSDNTIGNFDSDRVETLMANLRTAGLDFSDDLTVDDIVTNEYIDESIGLP